MDPEPIVRTGRRGLDRVTFLPPREVKGQRSGIGHRVRVKGMTTDTPDPTPLFEHFLIRYPSGTTFDSYWPGGATLREVELAHPMATVEPVEVSVEEAT